MEAENLPELTMYFINTFNKLAFSSEVSVEFLNISREKQYYCKILLQYKKQQNRVYYSAGSAGKNEF